MGKKKDALIAAGRKARKNWQPYHTNSVEPHPRHHNRPDCNDGKNIEDKHIRPTDAGRPLCQECQKLWAEATK